MIRQKQFGFRRARGCLDPMFALGLVIEKCLSYQTPLVISFIDYEQVITLIEEL